MRHSSSGKPLQRGPHRIAVLRPLQQLGAAPWNRLATARKVVFRRTPDDHSSWVQYVLRRDVLEYIGGRNGHPAAFRDCKYPHQSNGDKPAPELPIEFVHSA